MARLIIGGEEDRATFVRDWWGGGVITDHTPKVNGASRASGL